jgi:hypothetical protein
MLPTNIASGMYIQCSIIIAIYSDIFESVQNLLPLEIDPDEENTKQNTLEFKVKIISYYEHGFIRYDSDTS